MSEATAGVLEARRWMEVPMLRWSAGLAGAIVAGALIFEALGVSIFTRIGMPHEFCYLRDPRLVGLHVVSDLLIGLAYVAISATLAYIVYKASKGLPFNWVFLAFGVFIVSCGMTHFMEVWVIWEPVYWMSGYVKVVTAGASVATAVALVPLVPKVFGLVASARESEVRRLEIEQLNQELERFNYSVAHDLRAPLRGIAGFAHILREDHAGDLPPEALAYLGRIRGSVSKMDDLISSLLAYASVGRQRLELKSVRLEALVAEAWSLLDADVRSRNAEIIVREPLPVVQGDPVLVQVVLQNLIGNAIKYVEEGVRPRVEIEAAVAESTVTVSVTDNGVGIPAEGREKLFGLFERFHRERSGTGIGLAIVFRAVERLGGKVGAAPAPHGTGMRFWFTLALAPDTPDDSISSGERPGS